LGGSKDETQMWRELKKTARKLGIASIRMTLRSQREEDGLLIQRSHGPWLESDVPTGTIDILMSDLSVIVDFLCDSPLADEAATALREALETASERIRATEEPSQTHIVTHDNAPAKT
jgi:hypothetical protein